MKKKSQIGERIKSLRAGMSQAKFAELLGVQQATVSAWEVEENVPSPEAWLGLAKLAPDPDKLWFWQQAGVDLEEMLSLSEKILKERGAAPESGEVIRRPRLRVTPEGKEESGPLVVLPAEFMPTSGSTKCFILDKTSASFVFARGDIVVVDASDVKVPDLALTPFFDKIVLMEFNAESLRKDMPHYHGPEGLFIGKLCLQVSGTFSWEARLAPLDERFKVHAVVVGEWRYDFRDDSNPPRYRGQDLDRAKKLAPGEIRLYRSCRMIGRVAGWFAKSGMQNV